MPTKKGFGGPEVLPQVATYIVGKSCRLPGAASVQEFRTLLRDGRCAVTQIPRDRWDHSLFLSPWPGKQGKSYTFSAGVMDDIWGFDLAVFNMSPREAHQMDPQQRILLQVVWEALEDARIDPAKLSGERIGVYVGASSMDHGNLLGGDPTQADAYLMTGNTLSLVSNRISHAFDLRGPSYTVDTACSSALVALDNAQKALASGDIDIAIVGGVNVLLNPSTFAGFSAAKMLSPTGLCQSFSDKGDGYVRSEGAVAIVLQRSEAVPQTATARLVDSEMNADGFTMNVALPSEDGQFALLERLYERSGVDPNALSFVEAHGTGTLVGDPIEAHALGRAVGQKRTNPLPIGSAKSNVGHLEPVSGLVGVLKSLIAMEDRVFPRTLHVDALNPHINFEEQNLVVAREPVSLGDGPLMAGVSSFGFGGVNVHAILEGVTAPVAKEVAAPQGRERLLVTSAFCDAALSDLAAGYASAMDSDAALAPGGLIDQTWHQRGLHPKRLGVVASTAKEAAEALEAHANGQKHPAVITVDGRQRDLPPVFVYSGNGAQFMGMSRLALRQDADYRAAYDAFDAAFAAVSGFSLKEKATSETLAQDWTDCRVIQGMVIADQIALTSALAVRGMKPAAVIGHSGGEVSAAFAAGALTIEQTAVLAEARSRLLRPFEGSGTMAAMQQSAEDAQALLDEYGDETLGIAAINSPRSVTLVGPVDPLRAFSRWAKKTHRAACVLLDLEYPFHSSMLEPVHDDLMDALADLTPQETSVPVFSATLGREVTGTEMTRDYWWQNLRQPVLFMEAIRASEAAGFRGFVEIGAQAVLANYIGDSLEGPDREHAVTHTLAKTDPDGVNPVARAALRAILKGMHVEPGLVFTEGTGELVDLPGYPFQNTEIRAINSPTITRKLGSHSDHHPLLGAPQGTESNLWRMDLDDTTFPVLADHRVGENALLPGTAFAEMAYAAARLASAGHIVEVRDMDLFAPLVLSTAQGSEVQTELDPAAGILRIESRARHSYDDFREHARARFVVHSVAPDVPETRAPLPISAAENVVRWIYDDAARAGLFYGAGFRGLKALRVTGDVMEAELHENIALGSYAPIRGFDPVQMDCLLHSLVAAVDGTHFADERVALLPVRIGRLVVALPGAEIATGRLQITRWGNQSLLVNVTAFDAEGDVAVYLEGLRLRAAPIVARIDLGRQVFHVKAQPILADMPDVTREHVAAALTNALTEEEASDDALLLLDAAAFHSVWRALRDASKDGGYTVKSGDSPAEAQMLDMMARLELATPGDVHGSWHIGPDCDLPDAAMIAETLAAERPDLIRQIVLMERLPSALAQRLSSLAAGEGCPEPEVLFGRDAVAALASGPEAARRDRSIAAVLAEIASDTPKSASLRVAGLFSKANQTSDHPGFEPVEFLAPGEDPDANATMRRVKWGEAAQIDVLLVNDLTALATDGLADRLAAILSPGAAVIVSVPAQSAFRSAVMLGENPVLSAVVEAQLADLGFEDVQPHTLADGAGGGTLIVAQWPVDTTTQAPHAVVDPLSTSALWEAALTLAYGPVKTDAHGPFASLDPADLSAPLFLTVEPGADTAELSTRLLALRDILAQAAEAKRALTVIVPKGAARAGGPAPDPAQHALWSMLRTAANEYPTLALQAIDPNELGETTGEALAELLLRVEALPLRETEIVLTADGPQALRVEGGLKRKPLQDTKYGTRLARPTSGRLDALEWHPAPRAELKPDEVEVEVAATGLNYRDVMWAMGLLPEEALETGFAGPTLGLECAGRVSRVGKSVRDLAVGDPVVAFGPACFASHLVSSAEWVAKLPDGISLSQAATLPVAYFTAWYAMVTLGNLQAGETILIHGGAGGVGLAAIAIANDIGAEVIVTAGSPVKQAHMRSLGVKHILSSRDGSFADGVREITNGVGVDVVLNSLAGSGMEQSLGLLRPYGRFLELGKQDYYANTLVGVRALKNNISYHGIDVDSLLKDRPDIAKRDFNRVMEAISDGRLPPLPFTEFGGDEVVEAFRLMQRSAHVGKVVVRPSKTAIRPEVGFDPAKDGWFVIAGGTGGFGLETAKWLVRGGAKHIAILGRRAALDPDAKAAVDQLNEVANVRFVSCDMTDETALKDMLATLRKDAPIRGVFHTGMVLDDRTMVDMDAGQLESVLTVKTVGIENLDKLTRKDDLQVFVAYSSLAALIGNHGQAAYVAANAYQEAVILRRVAEGLPGLAVGWGAITDSGYLTRDEAKAKMLLQVSGNVRFTTTMALHALERILGDYLAHPIATVTPMGWGPSLGALQNLRRPTFELLRRKGEAGGAAGGNGTLRADLEIMPRDKAIKKATAYLKSEIAAILRVPEAGLSPVRPLAEYGMDSLMGVELTLSAQKVLGDDLPMPALGDDLTIERIAAIFVDHIQNGQAAADDESATLQNVARQHLGGASAPEAAE